MQSIGKGTDRAAVEHNLPTERVGIPSKVLLRLAVDEDVVVRQRRQCGLRRNLEYVWGGVAANEMDVNVNEVRVGLGDGKNDL